MHFDDNDIIDIKLAIKNAEEGDLVSEYASQTSNSNMGKAWIVAAYLTKKDGSVIYLAPNPNCQFYELERYNNEVAAGTIDPSRMPNYIEFLSTLGETLERLSIKNKKPVEELYSVASIQDKEIQELDDRVFADPDHLKDVYIIGGNSAPASRLDPNIEEEQLRKRVEEKLAQKGVHGKLTKVVAGTLAVLTLAGGMLTFAACQAKLASDPAVEEQQENTDPISWKQSYSGNSFDALMEVLPKSAAVKREFFEDLNAFMRNWNGPVCDQVADLTGFRFDVTFEEALVWKLVCSDYSAEELKVILDTYEIDTASLEKSYTIFKMKMASAMAYAYDSQTGKLIDIKWNYLFQDQTSYDASFVDPFEKLRFDLLSAREGSLADDAKREQMLSTGKGFVQQYLKSFDVTSDMIAHKGFDTNNLKAYPGYYGIATTYQTMIEMIMAERNIMTDAEINYIYDEINPCIRLETTLEKVNAVTAVSLAAPVIVTTDDDKLMDLSGFFEAAQDQIVAGLVEEDLYRIDEVEATDNIFWIKAAGPTQFTLPTAPPTSQAALGTVENPIYAYPEADKKTEIRERDWDELPAKERRQAEKEKERLEDELEEENEAQADWGRGKQDGFRICYDIVYDAYYANPDYDRIEVRREVNDELKSAERGESRDYIRGLKEGANGKDNDFRATAWKIAEKDAANQLRLEDKSPSSSTGNDITYDPEYDEDNIASSSDPEYEGGVIPPFSDYPSSSDQTSSEPLDIDTEYINSDIKDANGNVIVEVETTVDDALANFTEKNDPEVQAQETKVVEKAVAVAEDGTQEIDYTVVGTMSDEEIDLLAKAIINEKVQIQDENTDGKVR